MSADIDYVAALMHAMECDPSAARDAVVANLEARAYTRAKDVEADIEDLKRRDASRRAAP